MARTASARREKSEPRPQPMWKHGVFHWNELRTRDAERAKKFYRDTIGWTFERTSTPDGSDYWLAMVDGAPVAGMFPLSSPRFDDVPESWMVFLAVDDVDARVAKAVKAGATVVLPAFDIPNVGRVAMLREPGGAGVGWITPVCDQPAKGKSQ